MGSGEPHLTVRFGLLVLLSLKTSALPRESGRAMFDLGEFLMPDFARACAKVGVAWMDCVRALTLTGGVFGEGVRGIRPPAVLVLNKRPFVGVQTIGVAIIKMMYDFDEF